jgi:hypothetical protein
MFEYSCRTHNSNKTKTGIYLDNIGQMLFGNLVISFSIREAILGRSHGLPVYKREILSNTHFYFELANKNFWSI